ncbi:serine hydrolase domain-containing protein [Paucibacter sp. DJ2R-2]|uniref:serine hydrolase domain-containing protein n=1 Tax=Paucibacter sp. DJ2R-2 TaxID=2893558 RepID=UPI0021E4EB6B|nr:serine hydrolase domain-containing protein [Paucibacter sp. DJ2R-2]MCV2418979.1 beta-lactamase family protein [Paucibacter sp. DJ4R-1]MCV2438066.1 beta-lactamase family protein [Paucibacter sp. DJ2R-2]
MPVSHRLHLAAASRPALLLRRSLLSLALGMAYAGSASAATPAVPASAPAAADGDEARIARVLAGLRPPVSFVGDRSWTLQERMKHYGVPGLSITVIDKNGLAWTRVYGLADREAGLPVRPDTLFQAASISKPVAAVAALTLVQEGKLALQEPVNARLKAWRIPDNAWTAQVPVTLAHLLSHTGGLTVHGFGGYAPGQTLPDVTAVLDGKPPANSDAVRVNQLPGQAFRYSGGGYTVAQLLMSEADGRPFAELMQRRVLGPLGMAESTFAQPLPAPLLARAAAGVLPDGRAVLGKRHSYPELAAAGLWTTSQDLARFALGVQAAWRGDKTALLSTPMVKDMLSQRAGSGYGLGFGLPEEEGEVYFAHGGWNEGFCASLMAHPSAGVGMAIMINANQPALMDELRRAVAFEYQWPGFKAHQALPASAEALDKAPGRYRVNAEQFIQITRKGEQLFMAHGGDTARELVPVAGGRYLQREQDEARSFAPDAQGRWQLKLERRDGTAQVLARLAEAERAPRELLLAGEAKAALAAYRALRDAGDEAGSESYLTNQGYRELRGGNKAAARALLDLNAQLNPESANAWDSLGEVLLSLGDKQQAAAAYRRALALKPELPSAKAALAALEPAAR